MQIKNPSNKALNNIRIFGELYSIEAEGTLENVPEHVARYWQENLHKFLVLRKDKLEEKKVEVVEVPEPKVEELVEPTPEVAEASPVVEEEVKEESPVVVEKPKSKGRPKKVK